jgi:hypothetical protein
VSGEGFAVTDPAAKQVRVIGEARKVKALKRKVKDALETQLGKVDAVCVWRVRGVDEYYKRLSVTEVGGEEMKKGMGKSEQDCDRERG